MKKTRKKPSLRANMTLLLSAMVLIIVGVISFFSISLSKKQFINYVQNKQQTMVKNFVNEMSGILIAGDETVQESSGTGRTGGHGHMMNSSAETGTYESYGIAALYEGFFIKIIDKEGETLWDIYSDNSQMCHKVQDNIQSTMQKHMPSQEGKFITAVYPVTSDGISLGNVEVSHYGPYFLSDSDFVFLDSLRNALIMISAISFFAAVLLGFFYANKISNPIIKTSDVTKKMAAGNYDVRIEDKATTREHENLITSINHLAGTLRNQESVRKKMTGDIAHELRTPLTTVSTHLEAMIEGVWEPSKERLESLYDELGRITGIVEDLEKLAVVEGENLKLVKERIDLWIIISKSLESHEYEISEKNISLTTIKSEAFVDIDQNKFHQVINNLISNSIKYTLDGGKIQIETKTLKDKILLIVSDDGIGIPENELIYVFDRFYRADKSRNRKTGGSGIGMAITKSIVIAHEGSISVVSEPGQGSAFTVELNRP